MTEGNGDVVGILVFFLVCAVVAIVVLASALSGQRREAAKYDKLKPRLDRLDDEQGELMRSRDELVREWTRWDARLHEKEEALDRSKQELARDAAQWECRLDERLRADRPALEQRFERDRVALENLGGEKSVGFPWLAKAFAEYLYLSDLQCAAELEGPARARWPFSTREVARRILERESREPGWLRAATGELETLAVYHEEAALRRLARASRVTAELESVPVHHPSPLYEHDFPISVAGSKLENVRELAELVTTWRGGAVKAAEKVREIATHRRIAEKLYRVLKYQLEYYENLFPWLVEFKSEDIDDLITQLTEKREKPAEATDEPEDPARIWLTPAEYNNLPGAEKFQIALDRYWQKRKRRWELGRDYERYVGYLYEKDGYGVYYQGIVEGLEDLGRDLIALRGDETEVIQCKYWSQERTIHEKHVFQLFGTTVEYYLKKSADAAQPPQPTLFPELLREAQIKATFVTSTKLSEKARDFARVLGVAVREGFPLEPYPSIKCNVSRRTGERIYHLPFDQQYDRTLVEEERNECYASTVKEAEELGFRRAFRWRGESSEAAAVRGELSEC